MAAESLVRWCKDCSGTLPDDAEIIEPGLWWCAGSKFLVVNPKVAFGPVGFAFLMLCGREMARRTGLLVTVADAAREVFLTAFPDEKVAETIVCENLGMPIAPTKGGAA